MAQKMFKAVYVMAALVMSVVMLSCEKAEDEYLLNLNPKMDGSNKEVVISVSRDNENGIVKAYRIVNGERQDTTVVVALGNVNFEITPADTIVVSTIDVVRESFVSKDENFEEYEEGDVFYTKTVKTYGDELNLFGKEITISYLDAYTYVWGQRVDFPEANGSVEAEDHIVVAGDTAYTATTSYKVAFMDGNRIEEGKEVLIVEKIDNNDNNNDDNTGDNGNDNNGDDNTDNNGDDNTGDDNTGDNGDNNNDNNVVIPEQPSRETPNWLGNPVGAKYTRVQKATGEKFMDMIVFIYENGVVMAPNGKVNMSLAYAFDASVAAKNGVETCIKGGNSGVFGNGKWQPAKITIASGRWIYAGKSASWDHTVMANNAITLGIGVDVTPTPSAQKVTIENGKITIKYAVNNGSTTANSSLSLR